MEAGIINVIGVIIMKTKHLRKLSGKQGTSTKMGNPPGNNPTINPIAGRENSMTIKRDSLKPFHKYNEG